MHSNRLKGRQTRLPNPLLASKWIHLVDSLLTLLPCNDRPPSRVFDDQLSLRLGSEVQVQDEISFSRQQQQKKLNKKSKRGSEKQFEGCEVKVRSKVVD